LSGRRCCHHVRFGSLSAQSRARYGRYEIDDRSADRADDGGSFSVPSFALRPSVHLLKTYFYFPFRPDDGASPPLRHRQPRRLCRPSFQLMVHRAERHPRQTLRVRHYAHSQLVSLTLSCTFISNTSDLLRVILQRCMANDPSSSRLMQPIRPPSRP
jgi:hypothetical protein